MKGKLNKVLLTFQFAMIKWLHVISPALAARWFSHYWFRVYKFKPHPDLEKWKSECSEVEITHRGSIFKIYQRLQNSPKGQIVFVHGWSGRSDQFLDMAKALYADGFNVLSFDLPSHGENPGITSDIYEFAEFIGNANQSVSLEDCIAICHSAGFLAWSLFAKNSSQNTRKLVLIGCPGGFEYLMDTFASKFQFGEKMISELWGIVARRGNIQKPQEYLSVSHMNKVPADRVLIFHDRDDHDVLPNEVAKLIRIWPHSNQVITENLGHNRILRSSTVISQIAAFLN